MKEKEVNFKRAFLTIGRGFVLLAASCWLFIRTHKLLCAFIVSLIFNGIQAFALLNARAERDYNDKQAYINECKVDSLTILTEK